jgi:hypothetical protein
VAASPTEHAAHLFVIGVAEDDDGEALFCEALGPLLRAGDDGAGGVDDLDAAGLEVADDLLADAVSGDGDGPAFDLRDVCDDVEARIAQLADNLRVVDDGAEADHGSAVAHGFFHHLYGAPDAEAETHFTGANDLHV